MQNAVFRRAIFNKGEFFVDLMLKAEAQGMPGSGAPALIPNGQPPQWNRPPPMPHAAKTRPPPTGSNVVPAVSNGTPTPPSYSHPGSISSHSSRDPSPIPPNRHSEHFSSSSPNLVMSNNQHPQSPAPANNRNPPALVNQSTGPLPMASTRSYSQDAISRNIPSQMPQEQRLATSQFPPPSQSNNVDGRVNEAAPNSVSNGPPHAPQGPMPRTNAQSFATMRPQGVQSMTRPQQPMSMQRPPMGPQMPPRMPGDASRPPTGAIFPQPGMPPISSGGRPLSGGNLMQSGVSKPSNSLPPTSVGYGQPGMPPPTSSQPSGGYSQPATPSMPPPTSGGSYSQTAMTPSGGHPHPGMPPTSSSYSQPGLPPTSSGYSQPGMPPTSSRYSQPGLPPTSSGYSQPGLPPSSSGYSQPGMPPTSSSYSQPGLPPSSSVADILNRESLHQVADILNRDMPPTNSGYSQPGLPPTSSGYSQPGKPPSSSGYSQPGLPPTSSGYSQPGMPPSSSSYSQPGMPPTSGGYSQPGVAAAATPSVGYTNSGYAPNQSLGTPQPSGAQQDSGHLGKRYPQQAYQQPPPQQRGQGGGDLLASQMSGLSVTQSGFNKLWGLESVDLLQTRNVLPADKIEPPKVRLHQEFLDSVNCSHDVAPSSGVALVGPTLIRLSILLTIKGGNATCASGSMNYDPVSKTYGDPTRRPEVKSSTIEFIAPAEYMLRPPQPAVYLFLLDVSRLGVDCGYLRLFCDVLLEELDKLPGDGRTQVGFITYDSYIHFYNLAEGLSQPQQMIVVDTDDVFLPCPDNLLVNLSESRELVKDLLNELPTKFLNSHDSNSALGPALQAAFKLMSATGGRVTVFQSCLPNHGPGMLTVREDPSQRAGKEAPHLNPATDFYKRLALDCSGQQIAVDLFLINSQYSDLATLSGISRFSGGCIYHFPLFKASNIIHADSLERSFRRYLSRKIGFEAVMRIRCSRGLAIHTFHGNFFVRSTDLLSLPNVNPDAGFGMQVSIEESLSDVQNVCFQAALLYTSSKGERRIRVHTLCLPVAANLSDILYSADQQCIVGLLAKMAVDRSHQSSLSDARDAFINVAIDVLSAYKLVQSSPSSSSLLAPGNLRLLPLYILALLKYVAFRTGQSTRLDDRLFAMCQMKSLPLNNLIQAIYPDMYPVHYLSDKSIGEIEVEGTMVPQPPRLHLSAEKLDSHGAFLMDAGDHMMMYVGHNISNGFCSSVLGVPAFSHIPEEMFELPENESPESERLRSFVNHLQSEKPYLTMFQVIRDDSHYRAKFIERLIEDRSESALSYYEFLQHLKSNVK
ncbi:hypothetical protein C0J52_00838 [Blattella germanica]|nr:hypothetical protein C0J52_00838 [Blattella germanica]